MPALPAVVAAPVLVTVTEAVDLILERHPNLNDWSRRFCASILNFKRLSDRQREILRKLYGESCAVKK